MHAVAFQRVAYPFSAPEAYIVEPQLVPDYREQTSAGLDISSVPRPFLPFGGGFGLTPLPESYFLWLFLIVAGYLAAVTVGKKSYVKTYQSLL